MVVLQLDTDSESSIVTHMTRFSCEHSAEMYAETPWGNGRRYRLTTDEGRVAAGICNMYFHS